MGLIVSTSMEDTDDTRTTTAAAVAVGVDMAPVIDPRELNDLLDFAARGGLGQAVAYVPSQSLSPCISHHSHRISGIRDSIGQ